MKMRWSTAQGWKGNIRELENVVQRLLINKGENIAIIDGEPMGDSTMLICRSK
jgi:DNA-binding NtrC family response regulator